MIDGLTIQTSKLIPYDWEDPDGNQILGFRFGDTLTMNPKRYEELRLVLAPLTPPISFEEAAKALWDSKTE